MERARPVGGSVSRRIAVLNAAPEPRGRQPITAVDTRVCAAQAQVLNRINVKVGGSSCARRQVDVRTTRSGATTTGKLIDACETSLIALQSGEDLLSPVPAAPAGHPDDSDIHRLRRLCSFTGGHATVR